MDSRFRGNDPATGRGAKVLLSGQSFFGVIFGMADGVKAQEALRGDILIVDDNVQNAELLQAYLECLDCTLRIAADGVEAMEQIEREQPDIVLLDVMMPRMSGFEVCKRIKNDPKMRDIQVVLVTALSELSDVERGVDCGADDFISKPVNKLELLVRIRSMLRVRDLKSELERTLQYLAEIERQQTT